MNRIGLALIAGTLVTACATAQPQSEAQAGAQTSGQASVDANRHGAQATTNESAAASTVARWGHTNAALADGSTFNATLNAPLDSKKCKPGDPVTARTSEAVKSEGKTGFPKGTKLIGHVTMASARAKGDSESAIGVVFDKAVLKHGQEVPVNVAIQAIASAQTNAELAGSDVDTMGSMGGSAAGSGMAAGRGALGGVASTAGGAVGTMTNTAANVGGTAGGALNSTANTTGSLASTSRGAVGGLNATGQLSSDSRGVFGLNGLNISSAASNSTQGSVITSAGKHVHLDSGTRMLLVSQAQAGAGATGERKQSKPERAEPKSEPRSQQERPDQK